MVLTANRNLLKFIGGVYFTFEEGGRPVVNIKFQYMARAARPPCGQGNHQYPASVELSNLTFKIHLNPS